MSRNDTGKRIVELDEGLVRFAIENCESNIRVALGTLQMVHDQQITINSNKGQGIVQMIEDFRRLKKALEEAR